MSESKRMENRIENSNSCSPSSSLSQSAADAADTGRFSGGNWECRANRMVKIELEAAEALAGLAHSGIQERETYGSESGWNQVKLASQRVKSESPSGDSAVNPEHLVPWSSDLAEDKALVVQQQYKKICNVVTSTVMAKHDAELPNPSSICSTSYVLSSGGKSRQNMTEAEKEARRLRRVLANRESARQTIRRRQALYEELTRKAADLACENDNLKREKELAIKEYDSLKSTNQNLKAEMAKILKDEVEETKKESKSADADISTATPSNSQFFVCSQPPLAPFLWPSVLQASNPFQLQPISSNTYMPSTFKPDSSHEQKNPPLYILPCSWFFPFPDHENRFQPQPTFDLNVSQNNTGSSLEVTSHLENPQSSLPVEVKTEPSDSIEAIPAKNLHETPLFINALPEKNQDFVFCQSKKVVDSIASAEARKRRKELKRLKNLHCRQF